MSFKSSNNFSLSSLPYWVEVSWSEQIDSSLELAAELKPIRFAISSWMLPLVTPGCKISHLKNLCEQNLCESKEQTPLPQTSELDPLLIKTYFQRIITYVRAFPQNSFRLDWDCDGVMTTITYAAEQKKIFCTTQSAQAELFFKQCWVRSSEAQKSQFRLHEDQESFAKFMQLLQDLATLEQLATLHAPTMIDWVTLDHFSNQAKDSAAVQTLSTQYAQKLQSFMNAYQMSFFEKISNLGLGWTATYSLLRIHLLKFLALLPCLDHDHEGGEVKRLLLEALRRLIADNSNNLSDSLPWWMMISIKAGYWGSQWIPARLLAWMVRLSVGMMAKRFIAGTSIEDSALTLSSLKDSGREATMDQLGELIVAPQEADIYLEKVLKIMKGLKLYYLKGERNQAKILKAHVSIKVTALGHQLKPHAFEDAYEKIAPRLKKIFQVAMEEAVFINIDAEHFHYRDLVWQIYQKVLLDHQEFHHWGDTGIVVQAYLRDACTHLQEIINFSHQRKMIMPIRLVKGAYWDAETIEAQVHHYNAPQFLNKMESDISFRKLARVILGATHLQLTVGSHNLLDHCWAEALRAQDFPRAPIIEHQCLHMTYEALSLSLVKMGWPTRNYLPVGNLLVGMAYLVRRIMENSSQVGVLSMMRSHQKIDPSYSAEIYYENMRLQLLARNKNDQSLNPTNAPWNFAHETDWNEGFKNYPAWRPYLKNHLQAFKSSHEKIKASFPWQCDLPESNGEHILESFSPSKPEFKVAKFCISNPAKVTNLINLAQQSWEHSFWSSMPLIRCAVMLKSAQLLGIYRHELSAIIVEEAGKTMSESYADVDEAIDFINFYVRDYFAIQEKLALEFNIHESKTKLQDFATSKHSPWTLDPLGLVGVVAPWNFPLAIPLGMSVAPLIAGNAVLLKSAELTPLIAQVFVRLLNSAGVPPHILQHFAGSGQSVGRTLVASPQLASVVFTGSKAVGTSIYHQKMTQWEDAQPKVITEMGGKNAVIVTQNAELDETISGLLYAAFAHAGQKCSACSRILVAHQIKDQFIERFVAATRSIKISISHDPATFINPLIDDQEKKRVIDVAKLCKKEAYAFGGKVLLDMVEEFNHPLLVGPLLIELPAARALAAESFAQVEIFAPVVHIIGFKDLPEAVKILNSSEYALTGGIYAQSQDDIDYVLSLAECGNFYVNRPNTGARVGIEPFGGFKASGTGPKAGGKNYVLQFMKLNHENPLPAWCAQELRALPAPHHHDPLWQAIHAAGLLNSFSKAEQAFIFHHFSQHQFQLKGMAPGIKRLNVSIPGQQSYSWWNQPVHGVVMAQFSNNVSLDSLLFFIHAIFSNSSITIAIKGEAPLKYWRDWQALILNLSQQSLLSASVRLFYQPNTQAATSHATKDWVGELLKIHHSSVAICWIEGTKVQVKDFIAQLLQQNKQTNLPHFYHRYVTYPWYLTLAHPEQLFYHERAMAINTMRHGAPLE